MSLHDEMVALTYKLADKAGNGPMPDDLYIEAMNVYTRWDSRLRVMLRALQIRLGEAVSDNDIPRQHQFRSSIKDLRDALCTNDLCIQGIRVWTDRVGDMSGTQQTRSDLFDRVRRRK